MNANLSLVYALALLVLGLLVGSFLNVVIYRAPLGLSLLWPPSACPKCHAPILARDNIPVFSWLLLGGKCRTCRTPISARYPFVEALNALLWAAVGWRLAELPFAPLANIVLGLASLAFVSAMIVTFFVDYDHQIILDEISLHGTLLTLAAAVASPALHAAGTPGRFAAAHPLLNSYFFAAPAWLKSLAAAEAGLLMGGALALAVYYLGQAAFRKQIQAAQEEDPEIDSALGWGDVKLLALLGAFLGPAGAVFTFFAGAILGAAVGSAAKAASGDAGGESGFRGIANRWNTGTSVIPFGPFLVTAALLYFFFPGPLHGLAERAFRGW